MYQQIWGNTQKKSLTRQSGISSWMVGHRDYGKGAGPNHIHQCHLETYATSSSHWIPVWQWRICCCYQQKLLKRHNCDAPPTFLFWVYYRIIGIPPYTITLHPLVCSSHSRILAYTLLTSTNHKSPILLWSVDIRHNKSIQKLAWTNIWSSLPSANSRQFLPLKTH